MRPSSLRRDRQKQFNYMTQDEYEQELKKQIEEKRKLQMQERMQNQQEILNHYKNYQLGADYGSGENQTYMQDLDQLVKNKEMEIEKFGGVANMYGNSKNEVFQGDMNAFSKVNQPQNQGIFGNDKKNFDLFSDNFVSEYKQQLNKNNENLNIINSIFGNQNPSSININAPSHAESERERRLKLREMERMKRQEGLSGGDYGQITDFPQTNEIQPVSNTQQNIFGEQQKPQSAISKRDQVWQQKMQQRLNSQEGQRQPIHQTPPIHQNVSQMLPIYQNQGSAPPQQKIETSNAQIQSDAQMRSSRVLSNLSDARKLDQSINIEPQKSQQPPTNQGSVLLGQDDELIKKRRENEKKQRQQEYQEYLAKQKQLGKPLPSQHTQDHHIHHSQEFPSNTPITVPQSSQSQHRPNSKTSNESKNHSNPLLSGGMQQLGMHQQRQQEDKLKMQREYKQILDLQNQQKQQQQQMLPQDRKRQLSDQVFAEVLGSRQQFQPNQILQNPPIQTTPDQISRGQSASSNVRAEQIQHKQNDQGNEFFNKIGASEEEKKLQALQRKKEYAMQLQQQMALKQQSQQVNRRRGTSQANQQQVMNENQLMGQQKPVYEYQQPIAQIAPQVQQPILNMMHNQQHISDLSHPYHQMYPQQQQPYMQPPINPYSNQQQIGFSNPSFSNNVHPQQVVQTQQPDQKELARLKQEEYRRELEMQIKLKEEQKKQQQLDQQLYEEKQEKQFQEMMQQPTQMLQNQQTIVDFNSQQPMSTPTQIVNQPGQAQNFLRKGTDVRIPNDQHQDQEKVLKQMQYQAELQRQMEEKRKQKEEEKRKKKLEDEEHERKIQKELEELNMKQHEELVKEGRRDPNAPYQPPKSKHIKRNQFEPSDENPAVAKVTSNTPNSQWQKPNEIQKDALFGNDNKEQNFGGFPSSGNGVELPINNRREELFGNANQMNKGPDFQRISYPDQNYQVQGQIQQDLPQIQQERFLSYNQTPFQNYNSQPPSQQPDYSTQSKMMEEQSKMIQMYQQALEQILQFRNQYFEQAMQMRENIIKEREQLLEYEKMKQQQAQEIQQLQAVYNQLGSILNVTSQRPVSSNSQVSQQQPQQNFITPILNPQVQNNLNNLIISQKQEIMRMSQSGNFKFMQQSQNQAQNYPNQDQPNILEQSLSSETKFVNITQNKLAQMASSNGGQLFQTWKQDQLVVNEQPNQQQQLQSPQQMQQTINKSLAGSSHFINQDLQQTPQRLSGSKTNFMGLQSRPQTSNPPETIQELPKEEDEQVNQSKSTLNAKQLIQEKKEEEIDFNSRESSRNNSPNPNVEKVDKQATGNYDNSMQTLQQNMITNTNPLGNTSTIQENMLQIEQMINNNKQNLPQQNNVQPSFQPQFNQTNKVTSPSNKTQEKFHVANATGSSFYNQTLYQQKQQEQSQMEELQKQLMRIFGNTQGGTESQNSGNIMQQMMQKPATPLQRQQQQSQTQPYVNPLQRASYNEKMNTLGSEEKDILAQSNINIAESVTGTMNMQEVIQKANNKFSSNGFYNNLQQDQDEEQIEEESKIEEQDADDQEVQEIPMNDKPKIYESSKYRQQTQIGESTQQHDVWNDPDLIPPPVVMMNNDDDEYYFEPQMNQSNISSMNPYNNSMINDGTLKNLEMFSPPSDENNYNLGQYETSNNAFKEELQDDQEPYGTLKSNQVGYHKQYEQVSHRQQEDTKSKLDVMSHKSNTRKERDMKEVMEVAKLIQQATDKTNNLFENSDNFKFKFKRETDKESSAQNNKQPVRQNSSRKNIKTVDPFKNADSKLQNTTLQQNQTGFNIGQEEQKEKDDDILSNLDKMISNLQAQQQKNNEPKQVESESHQERGRPVSGIPKSTFKKERSKSNKKNRPFSAIDEQQEPKIGKYAQMALKQNEEENKSQQNKSQKSLGRFAQMALEGHQNDDQLVNEVSKKYGDDDKTKAIQEQYLNLQHQYQQQQILRPVSGKSNSTRYQQPMKPPSQQNQRNKPQSRQNLQQMYYDEESEDYVVQHSQLQEQENDTNNQEHEVRDEKDISTSGFNIGYVKDEEDVMQ